jgi:hypothetical protein
LTSEMNHVQISLVVIDGVTFLIRSYVPDTKSVMGEA